MPRRKERTCTCRGTGADGCTPEEQERERQRLAEEQRKKAAQRARIAAAIEAGQGIDLLAVPRPPNLLELPAQSRELEAPPVQAELIRSDEPGRTEQPTYIPNVSEESVDRDIPALPVPEQPLFLFFRRG